MALHPRVHGGRLAIDVVLGTRPEAVKLAPVVSALRAEPRLAVRVVSTGQHREMLDQVLAPFGIRPEIDLDVMRPGQGLNELVARIVPPLARAFAEGAADLVLVQGDTTSAFCAGLVAYHAGVRVAHVEAGLRSRDRFQPFPEEANRRMLAALADLHFAPTPKSADNLRKEGVDPAAVYVTGNTAIDALLEVLHQRDAGAALAEIGYAPVPGRELVLVTLHRRETWMPSQEPGSNGLSALEGVLAALAEVARRRPGLDVVFPVHKSPPVRAAAHKLLAGLANVHLLDPLPHEAFVHLMARARAIVTDSGGVQEEAPSLGVPVLVARRVTERPEGVAAGASQVVGTDKEALLAALERTLDAPPRPQKALPRPSPYGDGQAARRIREAILHAAGLGSRPQDYSPPQVP